jgi:tol-pal system protein YbgF
VIGERQAPALAVAAFAVAALLPALALPARAGLFDDDVARRQIVEQQKQIDALKQQNDALAERLAKVDEAFKEAQKTQPVLGLMSQIEALREELRQMRGQIETVSYNIDTAAKRQRDMYVDLDTRLRRLEQSGGGGVPPPPSTAPPGTGAAPGQVGPVSGASDEQRSYEAAQNQRRSGNYQGAITAFQSFIAQHPRSTLAPRAQYWIGDSYYNLRDYKNAITSQQRLVSAYPDSSSVPDALLNIASSQMELGDAAGARKTMDGLVARYPASEAAEKAKRRLATLK